MTYDEFLNDLEKIKSFAGRIKFANEHFPRIGSGSGRIVYNIDNEKVLKLAKNPKGIAQNEVEGDIGSYQDTQHIVTKVFENATDYTWIISELAKKVTERRIKELTNIPSLNDLHYFLRNYYSQNRSGRNIFELDKKLEEQLWKNEFANDLTSFIDNYNQTPGDMGRPSTYGEVLRDGQPSIVLTDYGLNDEVYSSHYSPQRKQPYHMYEMYNFADGNDDVLSDIGNTDEIRRGWALIPYGVGDGDNVVNENLIKFILKTNKYPKKAISNLPKLSDQFHDIVNNLNVVLNVVDNKKQFYDNLLALQDYLKSQNYYDRDMLMKEEVDTDVVIPKVQKFSLTDEKRAIELANALAEKLKIAKPKLLGGGSLGYAFEINPNVVLKLTADPSEVDSAFKIMKSNPKHLNKSFNVYKIFDTENNLSYFAILQENIHDKPIGDFRRFEKIFQIISPNNLSFNDFVDLIVDRNANIENLNQIVNLLLTDNKEVNVSETARKEVYDFFIQLVEMKKELMNLNIKSHDFTNLENLGYKDSILKFFDIGGYRIEEPTISPENVISLSEDEKVRLNEKIDKANANIIAIKVAETYGYDKPNEIGDGSYGYAYDIGNDLVLKVTDDKTEAYENIKLINVPLKHIAQPYKVFSIKSKNIENEVFVIILEKLETNANYFDTMFDRLYYVFEDILNLTLKNVLNYFVYKTGKRVDTEKLQNYLSKNPKDAEFFYGLLNIQKEIKRNNIGSSDFLSPYNLGYKKNGNLGFFDVGHSINKNEKFSTEPIEMQVDENGSALFSTSNAIGHDNLPKYNQEYDKDENNLEDIVERIVSSMKGSSTVNVKKRCKLGGLSNTSAACNQGDVKNLDIKSLDEILVKSSKNDCLRNNLNKNVKEGVADKYAEKEFYLEPEFSEFEKKEKSVENRKNKEEIISGIFNGDNFKLLKNPKSLNYIEPGARGIIDNNGNLYVEEKVDYPHENTINFLVSQKLINNQPKWIFDLPREFVTIMRIGSTNAFAIGESNYQLIPTEERDIENQRELWKYVAPYDESKLVFQNFLDKAKLKNPNLKFINVRIDSLKSLNENVNNYLPLGDIYRDYVDIIKNALSNDNKLKSFEKQIKKDIKTHGLNKSLIRTVDDDGGELKIVAVNGDNVRDDKFVEWYAGGHHNVGSINRGAGHYHVDKHLPKENQKYAKYIPEDEIWIDDLYLAKPNDMEAIILHERIERYLMKHYNYNYEKAHNIANKIEQIFREKVIKGTGRIITDKIYNSFIKKINEKKVSLSKVNENDNIRISSLKSQLAQAAQNVYDKWEQNKEGYCDWLGKGGICQDVAEKMCDVLYNNNIECISFSQQIGEQHVFVIAKTDNGVYSVDIPPYLYEEGGGYCWKKIPDVEFDERFIIIDKLSADPNDFNEYLIDENKIINEDQKPQKISPVWLNKLWSFLLPKHRNNELYKKWREKALNGTITDNEWQHLNYLLKNGDSMYNKNKLTTKK